MRESAISTTTPLFMHKERNGDFEAIISPTKPLNFGSPANDVMSETQPLADSSIVTSSSSNSSNESFKSAYSYGTSQISNRQLRDNSYDDTTPIVQATKHYVREEDIRTPKLIYVNENAEKNFVKKGGELVGLGLSHDSNGNILHGNQSSPVKALRVSRILDSHMPVDEKSSTLPSQDISDLKEISVEEGTDKTLKQHSVNETLDFEETRGSIELASNGLLADKSPRKSTALQLDEENLAYLFIVAMHSFNNKSLQNPEDISICLSFEKNDVAFVHTVDESGWGEVTLVKNQMRGWVPFNYFSDTIRSSNLTGSQPIDKLKYLIATRQPLEKLLTTCAKFLLFPQNCPLPGSDSMTFNVTYINAVRDGVKALLETTNCVSRSNALVQAKPTIRVARKRLLAEWYNLMIKADHYKHTSSPEHIKNLVSLVYEVLRKAFAFYATWSDEIIDFETNKVEVDPVASPKSPSKRHSSSTSVRSHQIPYLKAPPMAISRLHEIYDSLFTYVALILGRLDMIEHNVKGCETLELMVHQMIILLRELLYISKSCSSIIRERYHYAYEDNLDKNLDPLLFLVSELVSCIKVLVTQTLNEEYKMNGDTLLLNDDMYYHTDQGQRLIAVVSNMATLINNAISGCSNYLRFAGDFELDKERKYPDFKRIKITPEIFISRCSTGMLKHLDKESLTTASKRNDARSSYKKLARFSTIRVGGGSNGLGFSQEGTQFLQDLVIDPPFSKDATFDRFKVDDDDDEEVKNGGLRNEINNKSVMDEEIVFDRDGTISAASFRALVYKLTDETDKPDDFFLATFLLNFRSFGSLIDLIELLVTRFDLSNKANNTDMTKGSRMKNRRKLVCKVFQSLMESFWDFETDFKLLPTLMNFYNEGISLYLPMESKILIELAARLYLMTPTFVNKKEHLHTWKQLRPKNIGQSKTASIISEVSSVSSSSRMSLFSLDEKVIEEYELTHMPGSKTDSISLTLPVLDVGSSSLLSKTDDACIERIVGTYRKHFKTLLNNNSGELSTQKLVANWEQVTKTNLHIPKSIVHNDLNLVDLSPLEVAKQLTLIESKLYASIDPFELLNDKFLTKKAALNLAPRVNSIISFTNQLSDYVIEGILYPSLMLQTRVTRLSGWLKIALSSLYFRNFNSLASIMTALQNHAITRLDPVWAELSVKDIQLYDYLSKIVHPNNNFKIYRSKLRKIMDEYCPNTSSVAKSPIPTVPFLNLFLQDLTFINEGNPNFRNPDSFRPNKLVNFDKYSKIARTVGMLQFFQVEYDTDRLSGRTANRQSFFNLNDRLNIDTKHITPVLKLQEFILCEFWRVHTLHLTNTDRAYELSLKIAARH